MVFGAGSSGSLDLMGNPLIEDGDSCRLGKKQLREMLGTRITFDE